MRKPIAEPRSEPEIFADLAAICRSPGYAEAIAAFCVRDNLIALTPAGLTGESLMKTFGPERLVRTEVTTLIGLMVQAPWTTIPPDPSILADYMQQTETLLHELHSALSGTPFADLTPEVLDTPGFNPFANATAMREPIFYTAESAYHFQYRAFAVRKYNADDAWLEANKGFHIDTARRVADAVRKAQSVRLSAWIKGGDWKAGVSSLTPFIISAAEVAVEAKLDEGVVTQVLDAFALDPADRNKAFISIHSFNAVSATPLLRTEDGRYLLFQDYSLAEALYKTPFYWMGADKAYVAQAMEHRGAFTESFTRDLLIGVFGRGRVHTNVLLPTGKGATRGEIDVLVLFGDRAIVVQAKSKRLTLEARKGNDKQLKADFKRAVQDAHDQAMDTAKALLEPNVELVGMDGGPIAKPAIIREVIPLCVVADHYPALSFQTRQFLKRTPTPRIADPLIADVFLVDVLCEMLSSPLRLLGYLRQRAALGDRIHANSELTPLGYHLKHNLHLDEEAVMAVLDDSFCADLDAAMSVRRENLPGRRTPEGLLTRLNGTRFERLIEQLEAETNPVALNLGLMLLEVNEATALTISDALTQLPRMARRDRRVHDMTLLIERAGLTIHCSYAPRAEALDALEMHATRRKYSEKAEDWFGLLLEPDSEQIGAVLRLNTPWTPNPLLDALVAAMPGGKPMTNPRPSLPSARKIARNELCPCGSGLKYKKCHLT